ncbi:hypothetical protein BDN72DRAFT_796481, partial [Pluteus cervinus]
MNNHEPKHDGEGGHLSQIEVKHELSEQEDHSKPTLKRGLSDSGIVTEQPSNKRLKREEGDDEAIVKAYDQSQQLTLKGELAESKSVGEEEISNTAKEDEKGDNEMDTETGGDQGCKEDEGTGSIGTIVDSDAGRQTSQEPTEPRNEPPPAATTDPDKAIERGQIYFIYRPKVGLETAGWWHDVKHFQMLLVPTTSTPLADDSNNESMKRRYRLITIGTKHLPPETERLEEVYWAPVSSLGDDLSELEEILGEETHETKTRGLSYNAPARLAARGAYMLVNKFNQSRFQSRWETYLGFYLSHPPPPSGLGIGTLVQRAFGLVNRAMSFQIRVKNPLASPNREGQVEAEPAVYPRELMSVFGCSNFAYCARIKMLDYLRAQIILMSPKVGMEGLEEDIGRNRAKDLRDQAEVDSKMGGEDVLKELGLDKSGIRLEALQGEWV